MKVGGYLLLLASLVVGVYAYRPKVFDAGGAEPALVASLPDGAIGKPDQAKRTFAFDDPQPVLKPVSERASERVARRQGGAKSEPSAAAAVNGADWQATAVPAKSGVPEAQANGDAAAESLVKGQLASVVAADDDSRTTLVRGIKRELRRVGCYYGPLDSDWDRVTKDAMGTFTDRVNATLPYQQPDYVLLTLVRGYKGQACGETCPKGQSMNGDGRCLPNAVIARATRKPAQQQTAAAQVGKSWAATKEVAAPQTKQVATAETLATPRAELPGRMAMGAPGSASEASKSWWDELVGGSSSAPAVAKQQTLDVPVGLTHVPAPRPAVRPENLVNAPAVVQAAAVEPAVAGDGTVALPAVQATDGQAVKPPASTNRRASRPKGKSRQAERRWRGRNVQTMFQHPLGRM